MIDARGIIRERWVAEDPAIAPGVGIVLSALQELEEPGVTSRDEIRSRPDARSDVFVPAETFASRLGAHHV